MPALLIELKINSYHITFNVNTYNIILQSEDFSWGVSLFYGDIQRR